MTKPECPLLRILHISDLHAREPNDEAAWRRRGVLGDAWERNLDEVLAEGAVDLVCFTGDAAQSGRPEEYAEATTFFETLLARIGLGRERLFVVPGSHDICRTVEPAAWQALRNALARGADRLALARWVAGHAKPSLRVEVTLHGAAAQRQDVGVAYAGPARC